MHKKKIETPREDFGDLVATFQSTLLTLATSDAAHYEAIRSEQELLDDLARTSSGLYLNPSDIDTKNGETIAHASLDSHVKKVQADQLKTFGLQQLEAMQISLDKQFSNKKVKLIKIDAHYQPFEMLWFDEKNGYRTNASKDAVIEGTIEDILLERNVLLLKPKRIRRIINSNLKYYIVHVINPYTLEPAIRVEPLK